MTKSGCKLILSQAWYYCRRPECASVTDMEEYARMLEGAGIEVAALSGLSWQAPAGRRRAHSTHAT